MKATVLFTLNLEIKYPPDKHKTTSETPINYLPHGDSVRGSFYAKGLI